MNAKSGLILPALLTLIGCTDTVDEVDSSSIALPVTMKLFQKDSDENFHIPAVFVFDNSRNCIAKANSQSIYSEDFIEQIESREAVCNEIDLSAVEKETEFSFNTKVDISFLVLTDGGESCGACRPMIAEFESKVLENVKSPYVVHTIDVGMTAWFSGSN